MELPYYLPGTFLPSEGRVFILQESHAEAMVGFGEEYPGARLMNTKESFRSRGDETSSPRWETNQGLRPKALTYDKSDFSQKVFCAHGPWGTGWLTTHPLKIPPATDIPELSSLPGPGLGKRKLGCGDWAGRPQCRAPGCLEQQPKAKQFSFPGCKKQINSAVQGIWAQLLLFLLFWCLPRSSALRRILGL